MNHSNDKTEPFLTATEISKSLGICRESLRKMVLAGTVTGYRAHAKARRLYLLSEVRNCLLARRCTPDDERRRAAVQAVLPCTAILQFNHGKRPRRASRQSQC